MRNKGLVSIIVPVFNSSSHLNNCISSLISQDYSNIEIILVDDGSVDDSSLVCSKFVHSDPRVFYFYKDNGGASSARNYGLSVAKGHFVTFVDSDDYVGSKYVSDMVDAYDKDGTFVVAGMKLKKKNEVGYFLYVTETILKEAILDDIQKKRFYLHGGPTSKLFCLSTIKKYNIEFYQNLKNYEDLIFCLTYISHVKCIKYIESSEYVYVLDNMSMGLALNGFEGELILFEYYNNVLSQIDANYIDRTPLVAMYGNVFLIRSLLSFLRDTKVSLHRRYEVFGQVRKMIKINIFDYHISKKQYVAFFLLKHRLYLMLYLLLKKMIY